jgi:hypothetical protein
VWLRAAKPKKTNAGQIKVKVLLAELVIMLTEKQQAYFANKQNVKFASWPQLVSAPRR